MPSKVRYLVVFLESAGIYQGGDQVALSAEEYRLEHHRRPRPLCRLLEEWHEETDHNGRVIPDRTKVHPAPPDPPTPEEEVVALRRRVLELEQQIADLQPKVDAPSPMRPSKAKA